MAKNQPITTPASRRRLPPQRNPYWTQIRVGLSLGFRVTGEGGRGNWIARLATDSRYKFQALGSVADLSDYEDAVTAAMIWARTFDEGEQVTPGYTVAQCIEDYLAHVQRQKGDGPANASRQRAAKWIAPELGRVRVARLTTARIERWHAAMVPDGLDAEAARPKRDSANRVLSILRAALNRAFNSGLASSDVAWRRVKPFRGAGARRKVFLSPEQADALVAACEPSFGLLVRAALLTGARYGELVSARVRDLDLEGGHWHVPQAKTGARDVILAPRSVEFFQGQAEGKGPAERLFLREDGHVWGKSHAQRPLAAAVAKSELDPATTFYALRHSYVSRALLAGLPPQLIAENLGTSARMIELHYGHFLRRDRAALLARVDL